MILLHIIWLLKKYMCLKVKNCANGMTCKVPKIQGAAMFVCIWVGVWQLPQCIAWQPYCLAKDSSKHCLSPEVNNWIINVQIWHKIPRSTGSPKVLQNVLQGESGHHFTNSRHHSWLNPQRTVSKHCQMRHWVLKYFLTPSNKKNRPNRVVLVSFYS